MHLHRTSPLFLAALCATILGCSSTTPPAATPGTGGDDATSLSSDATPTGSTVTCSSGGKIDCTPIIEIHDEAGSSITSGTVVPVEIGDLQANSTKVMKYKITNSGNSALTVSQISLTYAAAAPTETDPAFSCTLDDGQTPCAGYKFPQVNPLGYGGTTAINFQIKFLKYDDQLKRSATLHVLSNDKSPKKATNIVVAFSTAAGQAKIKVQPADMDFSFVQIGGTKNEDVQVLNVGNSDLTICDIDLTTLPADYFTMILNGKEYPGGSDLKIDPCMVLKPGESTKIQMVYKGVDDKPHNGAIMLTTNDSSLANDKQEIKVKVNSTGPCLIAKPSHVVFGPTGVGALAKRPFDLSSCGDVEVAVTDVSFDAPGAGPFGVDWSAVTQTGGNAPTDAAPLKIPLNGSVTVMLTYDPVKLSTIGADGQPVPDTAAITVKSNTIAGLTHVTMEGVGSSSSCPTAIITVQEGDTVVPQTILHLDGKQSFAGTGAISKYEWSVIAAKGSVSLFSPNTTSVSPIFQPNVAGDYKFQLNVWDSTGKKSCFPAEKTVKVLPDQAIHVELLWNTPNDKDQTNEGPGVGSDMDLHFAHPYAAMQDFDGDGKLDPWFSDPYDCFWFNPHPEWGSFDPNVDDNPSLDRDDTDGAGPENLNLTLPEDGRTYSVGVNYFNDFGFGASTATINIYVYGQLVWNMTSCSMVKDDMWYVATISWPDGEVTGKPGKACGNTQFITPKYPHPQF